MSGAQLGSRRTGPGHWAAVVVRGLALVGLGLALERAEAQVVIVLVHLGVLVVVAALLARLPDLALAVVGLAAPVVGTLLVRHTSTDVMLGQGWMYDLAGFVWADGPYRLLPMVAYAALGILVARHLVTGRGARSVVAPGGLGAGLLVVAAAMLAAEQRGLVDLVPYSGTLQETGLDALVATGVCLVGLAAARALDRSGAARVVAGLAAVGAMTLTLYALQILWLAYDVRVLHPGAADDSWTNLAVLLVGSLLVTAAWRLVVRREPWRRGPIEGVLGTVTGLVERRG